MSYQQSRLWKLAFTDERDDVTKDEQEFFRNQYTAMRDQTSPLVGRISNDMKDLTVHDMSHLDALWEMGSTIVDDSFSLNPPEAFVFGASVLIHDAAMTVDAYPGGLDGLKKETAWRDSFARLQMEISEKGGEVDENNLQELATNEALRLLHASQAEHLAIATWQSPGVEAQHLISDPTVRSFYGPTIGRIAHSHWWNVSRIEEEFAHNLGPLPGKTNSSIDLISIASLLRLSDAMHIDARRAPAFLRLLVAPTGDSDLHWQFQGKMAVPIVKDGALQYSAASAFGKDEAKAWWLAFDAISMIDRELREVDHLLHQNGRTRFSANRVLGANSPKELSQYIKTQEWDPVDCEVRVSDVPKIVGALGGDKLYGNDSNCAIRELIQNAADAVVMRRCMQNRSDDWGHISVTLERRGEEEWLVVQDTGIGMSASVMTGPLVDFGNSFWRMPLAAREFPGIHASGTAAVGRYGIGFFAIFMLGRRVLVSSLRYDKSADSSRTLEFQNGLASRPILYKTPEDRIPIDGGTRVEVCLNHDARSTKGILASNRFGFETTDLHSLVGFLAPNLNVELRAKEDGQKEKPVVRANDWLQLQEREFLGRLSIGTQGEKVEKASELARLRQVESSTGELFGRASVQPRKWGGTDSGCVSVGGLRANSISWISGLFQGQEKTASRNSAVVYLPAGVLSGWATEQALLLKEAGFSDEVKAHGAAIISLCGGEIGDLPFARHGGEWLATADVRSMLEEQDEVVVHFESDVQYDEDEDEVHPKEFSQNFEEDQEVIFLPDDFPFGGVRSTLDEVFAENEDKVADARLSDRFREILSSVWSEVEEEEKTSVVGCVGDSEIARSVTCFVRAG